MAQPPRIRIGDLLLQHKFISEIQLEQALEQQKKSGRKLGRVLVENGFVREVELLNLLADQLAIPFIDILQHDLIADVCRLLPETLARRYRALPLQDDETGLLLAMADPTNIFAYDELSRVLQRSLRLAVVKEGDLLQVIDRVFQHNEAVQSLATELGEELAENAFDLNALQQTTGSSDAPVVRLLETLFLDALSLHASDVHIEPDVDVLRIRKRVDGVLQEQVLDQIRISAALVSRLKLMAGLDISEKRLPQDGRFNLKVKEKSIDIRLSTMPTQWGETVVMRLLDHSAGVMGLDSVGLEPEMLKAIRQLIQKPHGLMLVTGPTGSGKTTSLYAMLHELNQPAKKIVTVEDPVEYSMERVVQVQVNSKIGLDFARVLRSTLRHDPDIILVGEIRDRETAEIALRAAVTGHLVLSTLHTNDVSSTAARLLDMGMESYLLATALIGVLSQRLVRRVCEKCSEPCEPTAEERAWLSAYMPGYEGKQLMRGRGCQSCGKTGYRGRVAVHEYVAINEAMARALRENDQNEFERLLQLQPGYQSLMANAMAKAVSGVTTMAEVVRVSGWVE